MKMLNDELDNKLIGKNVLTSEAVLKLRNKQSEDVLLASIKTKSKECISILTDIANFVITKEHLQQAKEFINDNSKVYSLIKKRYQEQGRKYQSLDFLATNIGSNDKKQSRNYNATKSTEEIKGKVTDYYIKDRLTSKREYMHSTVENLNFEETKATSRLKDTQEKLQYLPKVRRLHFCHVQTTEISVLEFYT